MKLSKLARIYELGGEDKFYYILRHTLLNKSFLLSEAEYEGLVEDINSNRDSSIIQELKEYHILVGDSYDERKFLDYIKERYNTNRFDLEIIYLIFNSACNLKCKYCYVEGSIESNFCHQSMDESTFEKTITCLKRIISESSKKKLTFVFYGSEPLISKNLVIQSLEEITKICKEEGVEPEFNITTNGTLFDNNILEALKKYNVKVAVSLDGPKEVNDQMRIALDNKGTSETIIPSLKKLNQYKIPFGVSCTIGPHNIDSLKENISFFKELGATSVGFNTLLNARAYKIPQVSLNRLNESLIEASEIARLQSIYEDRIQRKYQAFHNSVPRLKDCGG